MTDDEKHQSTVKKRKCFIREYSLNAKEGRTEEVGGHMKYKTKNELAATNSTILTTSYYHKPNYIITSANYCMINDSMIVIYNKRCNMYCILLNNIKCEFNHKIVTQD